MFDFLKEYFLKRHVENELDTYYGRYGLSYSKAKKMTYVELKTMLDTVVKKQQLTIEYFQEQIKMKNEYIGILENEYASIKDENKAISSDKLKLGQNNIQLKNSLETSTLENMKLKSMNDRLNKAVEQQLAPKEQKKTNNMEIRNFYSYEQFKKHIMEEVNRGGMTSDDANVILREMREFDFSQNKNKSLSYESEVDKIVANPYTQKFNYDTYLKSVKQDIASGKISIDDAERIAEAIKHDLVSGNSKQQVKETEGQRLLKDFNKNLQQDLKSGKVTEQYASLASKFLSDMVQDAENNERVNTELSTQKSQKSSKISSGMTLH